jgi:DNA-directed RNA polymerase subunit F
MKKKYLITYAVFIMVPSLRAMDNTTNEDNGAAAGPAASGLRIQWAGGLTEAQVGNNGNCFQILHDEYAAALATFYQHQNKPGDERLQAMQGLLISARAWQLSGIDPSEVLRINSNLKKALGHLKRTEQPNLREIAFGLDYGLSDDDPIKEMDLHAQVKAAHLQRAKNLSTQNFTKACLSRTQGELSLVEKQIAMLRAQQAALVQQRTEQEGIIQGVSIAGRHLEKYQQTQAEKLEAAIDELVKKIKVKEDRLDSLQEQLISETKTDVRDELTDESQKLEQKLAQLRAQQDALEGSKKRIQKRIDAGNELLASDKRLWGLLG